MSICMNCGKESLTDHVCQIETSASAPLQKLVSAISLDDAKPSSFMKELTESLAKKEAPLIDETRLKTGQDWSVLATQVVGCER